MNRVPHDAADHRWLRIRFEGSDTVVFETSRDALDFTEFGRQAVDFTDAAANIGIFAEATVTDNHFVVFDNIGLPPGRQLGCV